MPAGCEPAAAGIRLVPFAPSHLLRLRPGAWDRAALGDAGLDARLCAVWPEGPALSAVANGRVLGCAGLMAEGETATAWALLSDELRRRPVVLHRAARRALDEWVPRFSRVRATVIESFGAGHRWALSLGFRPVRPLPGYGPHGETFVEYER